MSTPVSIATPPGLRVLQAGESRSLPVDVDFELLKADYRHLIASAGEDTERDGLQKTPERAAKAWRFLTSGYAEDPVTLLTSALFEEPSSDLVIVKDVEFYSMCEHHLLPFFGKMHVAYVPNGKIVGLSKVPRMVDALARRLQVQERLTRQVADAIESALAPKGVAVWADAVHMCMMMRGVEKQHSATATSAFRGVLDQDERLQERFLRSINAGH